MLTFKRGLTSAATTTGGARIKTGIILSRTPIVSPDMNELESNFYKYQSGLERRLMWTFPHYYFFKRGTLSQNKFSAAQPGPISKLLGVWFPKGVPDVKHNRERSMKQEVVLPKDTGAEGAQKKSDDLSRRIVPNSRITEADRTNDITSLERKLSRTLYLLVKSQNGQWNFPKFDVENTPLHIKAEEGLREIGGDQLHTWNVSRKPTGVIEHQDGSSEFLIKSHILAGKFELQKSSDNTITEFAWLTKEEIKERVNDKYFQETGFMLADN